MLASGVVGDGGGGAWPPVGVLQTLLLPPPPVRGEYRGKSRRKKEYKLKKDKIGKKRNVSKRQ